MRWQAAAALAAAAFAAGDFAAAAIAASGANPILDPSAARAAIPAGLRAGRVFSTEALPLCAGTACACAALLAWARSLGTKGARRDGEEHGSSRWATRKDIAPFGDAKDPDNNIILTDNARIRLVSRRFDLSTDTNDNVLVVGGPGTGKTRYYVKPNLLQANASFFVTDPKGTLIREMGGALAELGYEIRAFDTIDFTRSMRFNPIAYIRDEAGVIRFARGIVANTEGEADHKGDPYWEKAERLVYTALTAYLVMHCEPADRNLDGLLTLLSLADARDDPGYMSPLDMVFRELETGERYVRRGGASAEGGSLRGFAEEDGAWEWVKVREPAPPDDFALASYREFRVAAIIVTLINAACLVTNTLLPLLLQTSLGASAFETGMAMLPAAAVGIIISPISGVVFDKFGPRAISIVGLALMTGALFLLSLSTVNTPILVVALFCMLQSAGQSLANMPVNTWGVNALKNDMIAHGNAIANTGRQVAGGLCTALIITVMTSVTASAGVDASIQVATAVGAGVAYKVCAAIGLVSLICAIFSVRTKKTAPKTKEA